jgi:cobalamin-dependent methionine synthase I
MDSFEEEISGSFGSLTRRFSPGYGDLPLEFQKTVFLLLNPEKYIGLTLSESLLMTPIKSVSAIIGIHKSN